MKNLRGNHTSLTPLSQEVASILTKQNKLLRVAPGLIIRKNIKAKQVSIKIKDEVTSVLLEILMKGAKQYLRVYNSDTDEIKKVLKNFCESKQILIR